MALKYIVLVILLSIVNSKGSSKKMCSANYKPVCVKYKGKMKTVNNECVAKKKGLKFMEGVCKD
jgi:hypothetical protein